MKKRNIIILVILLAIGFAAVSTTLVLNGTIGIASNQDDFNIIFTNASLNNEERKDFIDQETKQTITFETNKLTKVDEEAVLDYEVTNTSKLYDGDVKIVCNLVDKDDNIIENYEYIGITYEPKSMIVEAGKKETGSITAKLKKAAIEDGSVKLKCKLNATAKERDKLPEDYPEPGDEVCYGTECFYVIKSDEYERKLLAKYNLYVGGGYETGSFKEYGEEATGKQDANMKGTSSSAAPTGTMAFSTTYPVDYKTSLIKPIIDEYTNYLKDEYGINGKGGLLTKADLDEIVGQKLSYGQGLKNIASDKEWLYDRSYWMQDVNGYNVDMIVASGYQYANANFNTNSAFGVRPVITITLKEKPGMLEEYQYSEKFWKYKSSITKVVFENALQEKEGYAYKFDVSEQGNGSVMSYLVANKNDTSTYTLYIQEDEKVIANPNSSYLFYDFTNLTAIEGLEYFDTSLVTNMFYMFNNCSSLTTLDLRSFNTSKVTNMSNMFYNCSNLTTLNLGSFNTKNVTTMEQMFNGCRKLTDLNLSSFNTSNVTNMSYMFCYCESLTSLDLSHFDTSKVTTMYVMFENCSKLTTLNISSFNTSNVINMYGMFQNCGSLTTLDLSHFDTSKVTTMEIMFYRCSSLTTLDLRNFNTSNVTSMTSMFAYCSNLTTLDISNFNTENLEFMGFMFGCCSKLATLDLSSFDTRNVKQMWSVFADCSSLTELDLSNFYTNNAINMSGMFHNCKELVSLDISNFNTSNVTNMENLFAYCNKLKTLDLSSFDTSKVTNMHGMFDNCGNLTALDLSNFDTSKVTNMERMFFYCNSLATLDISKFDTSNVTETEFIFYGIPAATPVYVKDSNVQSWILGLTGNDRPKGWSNANIIIKS